ncbi:right-handed parallel beta-helix repeat-containing protein [Wenjunlia tyrosinilytica]|jgi:nitrous oxidase accessory protein NosD|nr:right-handed parallel beta-helix repeat-containing protein [Wenjunlia tyrosinilytica]
MLGRPTRFTLACALAAAPLLGGAGLAAAENHRTWVVEPGPGTPIQKAVDRARPGDTVVVRAGHYRENVVVTKALTILGAGAQKRGTALTPPKEPTTKSCEGTSGFCVLGTTDGAHHVVERVGPVRISGFLIRGFEGSAVLGDGTERLQVDHVRAWDNDEYGLASLHGRLTSFGSNKVSGSEGAGLYIGDSPDAEGWIGDNNAGENAVGILLRDSTGVEAVHNTATANCVGIEALNTGHGATPGGFYKLVRNTAEKNNEVCPANDGRPTLSGLGIGVAGARSVLVKENIALGNETTVRSIASGGIAVFSTRAFGGADPSDVKVVRNVALHNRPDLFWDGTGTGIHFCDNEHRTSRPAGLG